MASLTRRARVVGLFAPRRGVAQLVAQRSPKPQVAGSSPVAPAGAWPAVSRSPAAEAEERRTITEAAQYQGRRRKWPDAGGVGPTPPTIAPTSTTSTTS